MLRMALTFLILALIAGVLGFVGLEGTFMWFARLLCFLFVILFLLSLAFGRRSGPVI